MGMSFSKALLKMDLRTWRCLRLSGRKARRDSVDMTWCFGGGRAAYPTLIFAMVWATPPSIYDFRGASLHFVQLFHFYASR